MVVHALQGEEYGQPQETEHHHVLNPVVTGQHRAQFVILGMKLDQRIQRHDEHATE